MIKKKGGRHKDRWDREEGKKLVGWGLGIHKEKPEEKGEGNEGKENSLKHTLL